MTGTIEEWRPAGDGDGGRNADRTPDWASDFRAAMLAWGIPTLALIAASYAGPETRTVGWIGALAWMGTACLINARRCGRTHCRYTGPYFLLLTVPVGLYGFGALPLGPYGWWILGALILIGGKAIWWATEARWGRYRGQRSR